MRSPVKLQQREVETAEECCSDSERELLHLQSSLAEECEEELSQQEQ
jgi:hypothetical protein